MVGGVLDSAVETGILLKIVLTKNGVVRLAASCEISRQSNYRGQYFRQSVVVLLER